MLKVGRPKDIIWEHFLLVNDWGKSYAKCKSCDKIKANRVDTMKSHFRIYSLNPPKISLSSINDIEKPLL